MRTRPTTCSIPDCPDAAKFRGWCGKHYQRWLKHGDPLKVAWERNNPIANFWAKVDRRGPDECWPWLGYIDRDGYGHFAVPADGRQDDTPAHRYAYTIAVGPIPDGHQIDHTCHTRAVKTCTGNATCAHRRCCNPRHAEPVLPGENIRRGQTGMTRARQQREKTHCVRGHPFDAANTRLEAGPKQYRRCLTCERERGQRRSAAARAARQQET